MQDDIKDYHPLSPGREPGRFLAERPSGTALSTHLLQAETSGSQDGVEGEIGLLHLWWVLVNRKWTIITFFLIVVSAVVTATLLMTPIYRASVTLQIEREAARMLELQTVTPMESPHDRDFYQTQYELLQSRSLAQRVIDRLALAQNPVFTAAREPSPWQRLSSWLAGPGDGVTAGQRRPDIVKHFLDHLEVEPVRNSRLVKVHFDSPDPALSARIVNALAEVYLNMNLERRMDASSYVKDYLQERLQQVKAKLEDSERELVAFTRREEIVNIDERQTLSGQNLQQVSTALSKAGEERIKAEAIYRQAQDTGGQGLTQILDSKVIQTLKESKAKLEAEYQDNLKVYKPPYPRMQQLQGQIAEIQSKINEEVANIRSAIEADYEAARASEELLSIKLEEFKSEVLELQNRSIQYNILKREVDTNHQLYEALLQRYKEVGLAGGVGTNNLSLVDPGEIPTEKFKPSLKINGLLAVFLGLFGGIGLAFLFEHLDDTVKQPEDLERQVGLSVLGIIPMTQAAAGHGSTGTALALTAHEQPRSAFAEAYRSVRTALQFSTPQGTPRVLLITSSAAGEGKSTTALTLAINFAQAGHRVLLIDADLRNPSLHRALRMGNRQGLTDHLAGDATPTEIAKPTVIPKLFMICAGPLPPNPAELLSGAKMVSLLSLASEKFDQVILDGPPVLGLADALILGNMSEGTILVVESGGTRRGYAQGALKRLRSAHTRVLGGILTKLDARHSSYGYGDNYYYTDAPATDKRLTA